MWAKMTARRTLPGARAPNRRDGQGWIARLARLARVKQSVT
jgi:hypothetical protein